jgi:5-methylcytosine-specific restriction endonuclease McrA
MPKKRQPIEIWRETRRRVLERDGYKCVRPSCGAPLTEKTAHIDHIESGKNATNEMSNLRSLCRRCHVLRADPRHRGMIAGALKAGIIGPDWRSQVWDDDS